MEFGAEGDVEAIAGKLWEAADKLRGSVDAGEYKHVVLGLLFLKYISDAFAAHRIKLEAQFRAEGITKQEDVERLLEDKDEYLGDRLFWVPPKARWEALRAKARQSDIATVIDDAMFAIEKDNEKKLKGVLPRDYARRGLPPERLGGLIDIVSGIGFKEGNGKGRDLLGHVYQYFLGKFAAAEGKLGGEFFTPPCVVRLLVEMIEPFEGRVYDPCCGSGGMFVQSERFVENHGGQRTDISVFGQESNPTTRKLALMSLAINGIEADLGAEAADTFTRDLHPDLKADFILANPPFNISDWGGELLRNDPRWQFGAPPVGNANYAWIQHFIHHLAYPNGRGGGVAGFVMANGSLSSNSGGEGEIRKKIIEADLVDCIVAMPAQLFLTTGIPVCLWFLTRDKSGKKLRGGGGKGGRDRRGQTLFIDARKMGRMETRVLRVLSGAENGVCPPESDIGKISGVYHAWRGEKGAGEYADVPGFCKSAGVAEIVEHGHVLTPGRYVGTEDAEDDGEPFDEKLKRLQVELNCQFDESVRLMDAVRDVLRGVTYGR
jgi:type I restriction enzyme M protein